MLKGKSIIELTDVHTGKKEIYEDETYKNSYHEIGENDFFNKVFFHELGHASFDNSFFKSSATSFFKYSRLLAIIS